MSFTHTPYREMFRIPMIVPFVVSFGYDARPRSAQNASPELRSHPAPWTRLSGPDSLVHAAGGGSVRVGGGWWLEADHEDVAAGDVRAAGLGALVLRRAHPDQLPEPRAERAEAAEPDQVAHLGHRQVRRPEQVRGPLDPAPRQVLHRRLAVLGRETPQEVVLRHPRGGRQRCQVERLGLVAVGNIPGPPQVRQQVYRDR